MTNELKFLQSFKGKTVDEVIELLEKEEREIKDKQSLAWQEKMEWYKNCIGKYYKIQHNNTTFSLVYIKEGQKHKSIDQYVYQNNPHQFLAWECYTIILSDQPRIVSNAGFDVLWLGNPFERNKPQFTCEEIIKEEFEGITSPFDSLINKAKQILKTK